MCRFYKLVLMGVLMALLCVGAVDVAAGLWVWEPVNLAAGAYTIKDDATGVLIQKKDGTATWPLNYDTDIVVDVGSLELTVLADATVRSIGVSSVELTVNGPNTLNVVNTSGPGITVGGGLLVTEDGKLTIESEGETGILVDGQVVANNGSISGKGKLYGIYAASIGGYEGQIIGIAEKFGNGANSAAIFSTDNHIYSEGNLLISEVYTDPVTIDDRAPVNPYANGTNILDITRYTWTPNLTASAQGLLATRSYSGAIQGSRTQNVDGEPVILSGTNDEHRITFANAVLTVTPPPPPARVPIISIEINEGGQTLELDEAFHFTVTVSPSNYTTTNPVTWESDKPGVASVDDKGVVTAKSPGTATITAKIMDGDFDNRAFSDSVKVTVPELEVFDIGIEVLAMKACKPLELPILAGYKGTWTIGNASIARVGPKQKLVKALTRGETTLTFTVENVISKKALVLHDRVLKPGDTYVIRFNVRKAGELPKSISLDRKKLTLDTVSNTTAQLTATVKPLKALDREVFFLSKNPSVATVDRDGNVTAVAPGTAKILAVSANLKRAVVTVTVESAVVVKPVKKALKVGGTVALEAVVQEALPDKALVWTSNKPDVASVDENGVVTGLKKGKVGIVATATNGDTARCVVTVRKK